MNETTLNETPRANRIHIVFLGLRNAGKSTLVNAFTGQEIAIVSDVAGTTTDPVSKAMEILPLGPCLVTDTAGLDDVGDLGRQRVEKSLRALETADIAVWVWGVRSPGAPQPRDWHARVAAACLARHIPLFDYHRGDSVEDLKTKIAATRLTDETPGLLDGLVAAGDHVVCVCPIDDAAPKGRLILPQVQVLRDCLDRHATCTVCQPEEFVDNGCLTIVDSQAFSRITARRLTSFSILFARQKGDLAEYLRGLSALASLRDGDRVLVAEGCTHHRQCNDIGTVKIPKAVTKQAGGKKLDFVFSSGGDFDPTGCRLVVHCGGCMLTRREMLRRIERCRRANVPIVNYGLLLARAAGVEVERCVI